MGPRSRSTSAKRKRDDAQNKSGGTRKTKVSKPDLVASSKRERGRERAEAGAEDADEDKDVDGDKMEEYDEEVVNMADVSGFSRYSIDTTLDAAESETEEDDGESGANTSGVTDGELSNHGSAGKTKKSSKEKPKMVKMPVRGAARGMGRGAVPQGAIENVGRGRVKSKVPLHPMIYEQQSYNSSVPMWEDGEQAPVVHRGYLTYKENDGEHEVAEGDWRDVGYFNTAERRRLHGDYDQYIEEDEEATYSSPNARNRRPRRRVSFGAEVKYSLAAHAISMTFVFVILLATFLFLQYIDLWGQFKDTLWTTYYHLYDLYRNLASGSYTFTCSVGGSPFQMIECEIKQSFNRLLLSSVTQCVQFVNAAMKVDNVPHAIALLAGAYSALSAAVWSVKWPVKQLGRGIMGLLMEAHDGALRVCHNSGI